MIDLGTHSFRLTISTWMPNSNDLRLVKNVKIDSLVVMSFDFDKEFFI